MEHTIIQYFILVLPMSYALQCNFSVTAELSPWRGKADQHGKACL